MKTAVSIAIAAILWMYAEHPGHIRKQAFLMALTTKSDSMTYPAKHISVSINRPAADVYQFASNPENFPKWVAFVTKITRQGDEWLAESTLGNIRIKFPPQNNFHVIDHDVTLPNGHVITNPMRVIDNNNKGCEFIFTLFRRSGVTEDEFNKDVMSVTKDLQKLKKIMEVDHKK